jgi:hypothetical protein
MLGGTTRLYTGGQKLGMLLGCTSDDATDLILTKLCRLECLDCLCYVDGQTMYTLHT